MRITTLKLKIPKFKPRSERETEEMLHRYKVIDRKRQIALIKLDVENFIMSTKIQQYNYMFVPKKKNLLKIVVEKLSLLLP